MLEIAASGFPTRPIDDKGGAGRLAGSPASTGVAVDGVLRPALATLLNSVIPSKARQSVANGMRVAGSALLVLLATDYWRLLLTADS